MGPDGISPVVIRECEETLVKPLVFREIFLNEGNIPNEWSRTKVTPILKKKKEGGTEVALN